MKQKRQKFSIIDRFKSFRYAFAGLSDMIAYEHNAWLHLISTILVVGVSWWLGIDREAFALIVIAIVAVWMAETFNTVLEMVVDISSSEKYSEMARRAKDIAAAAVFITALGACVIGIIILGPPLYTKLVMLSHGNIS